MTLRVALAILFVVSASAAVRPQDPDSLDAIRRLLRDARYVEAESGAGTLLAQIEAAGGGDSVQAARIIDTLVEALWRGGKVRAPETRRSPNGR